MLTVRRLRAAGSIAAAIVICGVLLFPIYWMVNAALQPSVPAETTEWIPLKFSLSGVTAAFASIGPSLLSSILVALGATLLCLLIAIPAAFALSRLRGRVVQISLTIVLITQMVPTIVIANALYTTFNSIGLLNTLVALIIADSSLGIPFSILVLRSFMVGLDSEVLEAAEVDGAGLLRRVVAIVVPLSRNAIITAGLFAFLYAWGDLLFALTLAPSLTPSLVTLGIYEAAASPNIDWAQVMAVSVIASLPAIVILAAAQRFLSAGIASGAGK